MKFLIKDDFPVSQLLLFRSVTTAVGCTIYAYYAKIPGGPLGPPEDRFWLNFRGTLGAVSIVTFFLSLENLTLGDTLALSFISPVIMPILSSIWLGEDYTSIDAIATFIAMTGVTFISKPEFLFGSDDPNGGSSSIGIFYAVIAASTGALSNISIRKISKKSTSIHIVNYMMLWTLPVCLGMIYNEPSAFKFELNYFQAGQFLIVAFFSFIGQYWLGRSLLTTPARFVSPIMFTQVFYAYINQFVFWGIMPTSSSTVGVALVACSLLLLHFKI
ncbi:hypothetical protein CONCODRAFT_80860 [Conidiobolus coronatus NRRL 28638]|uniref:EamA domain-containing protein n=1 Tax=Conidiobolus coronatus (strain ATCC 28846 / CBS 209.66 / NRRL 28638) TaxID=796925 RepID=A0A137NQV2_CONC2|nr:hypothetical protein CONCODRAFT_80860 [Conidiobolus coronatus NRRL 28638]|eukprot:KXN65143.1 hypothetical protein CONCODRAFT_80860 [Conidiobolus coronatus NRRL 28638]